MYYTYEVTAPTKIKSIESYKERIFEIVHGQMRNIVLKERFSSPFFWLLSVIFIPMSVVYFLLCLCEIVVDTVLLPLSCVPIIRGITFVISTTVWALCVAIGIFALVPLTYNVDYYSKNEKMKEKNEGSISEARQTMASKQLDTARKLYIYYGVSSRFNDDMNILCEEHENILSACKDNFALSLAARKCMATSMYYLFELSDIYYTKESTVGVIEQIIYNETYNGKPNAKSFLNSKSWFKVRTALIGKINGYVAYGRKRYAL